MWAIAVFLTLRRFLQSDDPLPDFDPTAELKQVQVFKKLGRIRPYSQGRSQLDPYTAELLALHDSGARPADLQAVKDAPAPPQSRSLNCCALASAYAR